MRFNCHCHIFNFQAINTACTREVLISRLLRMTCPESLRAPMEQVLSLALGGAGGTLAQGSTDLGVRLLMMALEAHGGRAGKRAGRLLERLDLPTLPFGAAFAKVWIELLFSRRWRVMVAPGEVYEASLRDVFAFLEIMLEPSIPAVAEGLLALGQADVLLPLAMDITDEDEPEQAGRARYEAQLAAMLDATRAHPGRLLPFVAFNGQRPGSAELARKQLEAGGFVGLKLYPSLDATWPPSELRALLEFCAAEQVPVLAHCMPDGFQTEPDAGQRSHPRHWRALLGERSLSDLVLCLGHFGGDTALRRPIDLDPPWPPEEEGGPWPEYVLALMRDFPGRVFADLAFHTKPCGWADSGDCGPDLEVCKSTWAKRYFEQVGRIIDHPVYGTQVLWGTDYSMTRALVEEEAYTSLFRQRLGPDAFSKIAELNPRRFLGMASEGGTAEQCRASLRRHCAWLDEQVGPQERTLATARWWGL